MMRELNNDEQYVVQKLVSAREKTQVQEMCLATIMDESLDNMAVEWDANQVSVFTKKSIDAQKQYMYLCDIIALFQYLEKEGMILVHTNPDLLQEKALYNHNMYKKEGDRYVSLDESGLSVNVFGNPYVVKYSIPSQHSTTIYSDLSALLGKYACAFIHPTQELVDYVNNGYKTKEDKRYCQQRRWGIIAIIVSFVVGLKEEIKDIITYTIDIISNLL
ncbi:MAG: hypothetical protein E7074_00610 [Bacteroidales bacterium]|nr:hypothetical protein [Bacteroidales bacterium]